MIVGRTLSDQYYSQIKKEADFRFGVIGTRDNAEAIAFYDINAVFEKTLVWQLFSLVFQIQSQIIFTQLRIESFSKLYEYAAFVIPYLVMASSYFAGNIDAGSILQSNDAFFYIRSDFSVLINNYEELSLFAAGIDRLSELKLALSQDKESLSGDGKNPNKSKSVNGYMSLNIASSHSAMEDSVSSPLLTSDNLSSDFMRGLTERLSTKRIKYNFTTATTIDSDTILSCENLRVCTPDGKRLLGCLSDGSNSVSLSVTTGDRLLITGSSGVGKSSLLRALAGLWTTGTGSVTWHRNSVGNSSSSGNGGVSSTDHLDVKDAIFLPQSAYVGRGTLRQLIQYPSALLDQHHQSSQTDSDDLGSELLWGSESGITQHRSSPIAAYSILTRGLQEDQVLLQILSKVDLLHIAKSIGDGSEVLGLDIVSDLSKVTLLLHILLLVVILIVLE